MINFKENNFDITKNIKVIEMLKCELLNDMSNLFRALAIENGDNIKDITKDSISNIIILSYCLGRRLGVDYKQIEKKIDSKLKLGLIEKNELERSFGDITYLSQHRKEKMEV